MNITGYTILDKIADGGMASVYLAEKTDTHDRVAIKLLSPEIASDLSVMQRFIDEAEIVAQLNHPSIVPILDIGQVSGTAYFTMEFLPGGNLRERMEAGLTENDILQITTVIAEALGHTHLKGVLHLDVTPRNILFRNNGDPVLADFGVSKKYLEPDFDNPSSVMGNPRYMSPEQIRAEKTDPRTDLYSLGVIFYEMLAGHLPYEAESGVKTARMHLYEVPEPLPEHYSQYQVIIDQLLEKIPDRRFHSVKDFLNALGELHASVAVMDDKTLIYPVKQTAAGQMSQSSTMNAPIAEDPQFFEFANTRSDDTAFADQTDPLSVEEVMDTEQKPAVAEKHLNAISDQFNLPVKPSAGDADSTRVLKVKTAPPEPIDDSSPLLTIDSAEETDETAMTGEFNIDPDVLVAVRDDLSATALAEKRFSFLNVAVILALFSGALWLWSTYKDQVMEKVSQYQSGLPEGDLQNDSQVVNEAVRSAPVRETSTVDNIAETTDEKRLAAKAPQATPAKVSKPIDMPAETLQKPGPDAAKLTTVIPGSLTGSNALVPSNINLTEIILAPDTGLQLLDDQLIISRQLEMSLKHYTDRLQREHDGSLKVFLVRSQLYEDGTDNITADGLRLLNRLAYVFRNNQDFLLQITDRMTRIDSPGSYRDSIAYANNVRDFLVSQGLQGERARSTGNTRYYRDNFSGIELQLIPDFQLDPTLE